MHIYFVTPLWYSLLEEVLLMFTSRINDLFQYLGARNGQVAKLAGFDRTNISRLRSSGRTPESRDPYGHLDDQPLPHGCPYSRVRQRCDTEDILFPV